MSRNQGLILPVIVTLAGAGGQIFATQSGAWSALTGLMLVLGGTLSIALISHSASGLIELWQAVSERKPERQEGSKVRIEGLEDFLYGADCYRRGDIRRAEAAIARVASPLLRHGAERVIDGFPREPIHLALQRELAEQRERLYRPFELLRAMANYAPAFGMIGTLLGLIQMLFALGQNAPDTMGSSMGFAMLTTVYGLVLANLVFKPLAARLEQAARERMAGALAELQAVELLIERQHSNLIREALEERPLNFGASTSNSGGARLRLVATRQG